MKLLNTCSMEIIYAESTKLARLVDEDRNFVTWYFAMDDGFIGIAAVHAGKWEGMYQELIADA